MSNQPHGLIITSFFNKEKSIRVFWSSPTYKTIQQLRPTTLGVNNSTDSDESSDNSIINSTDADESSAIETWVAVTLSLLISSSENWVTCSLNCSATSRGFRDFIESICFLAYYTQMVLPILPTLGRSPAHNRHRCLTIRLFSTILLYGTFFTRNNFVDNFLLVFVLLLQPF